MVSAMMVVAVAVVASMVAVSAQEQAASHHRNFKCKPNKEEMEKKHEVMASCFEDVSGTDFEGRDSWRKAKEFTPEEKHAFGECVGKATGLLNEDGSLNVEHAKQSINSMETDDDTKAKLTAGVEECGTNGEDVLDCIQSVVMTNCDVPQPE